MASCISMRPTLQNFCKDVKSEISIVGNQISANHPCMNMSYALERKFVEVVMEVAKEKDYSFSDVARRAFPTAGNPVGRWRAMRNKDKSGPQSVTIADAARLAHAVGEDLSRLIFRAEEKM